MQLARQGKISLEEDSAARNVITIESGHVDGNKDSCNATHGDNTTSNEDTLFEKEDSSDTDDCMSTITFTDEDLLLGSKPHNRPLFVVGYPPHDLRLQSRRTKGYWHYKNAIDYGGHDEKGFDPKAFKLFIKAGYNPKEKLSFGKLPFEATGKKLYILNATQMMLKEKGNAIQDSRVGLGSTLPKPIRIAIKDLTAIMFLKDGIAPTYHITLIEDNEVEEEDAEDAPVELKEGKVNKHIEVGFIREVKYPMWISSILPKLKHYFQSHSIHLVSKANPLKYVMAKLVLLDRLARWYLQMQQFEITYVPQKAVKGQVLANFLVNHPIPAEWELSNDLPNEDVLVIEVTPP
ncbi:UNVERIFIED_CONTAM: hypothetical protein Scaly_2050400 [Sesamum calycinum]|uniref:Uncharacterized protein n=1 Tax=Sesamum calycinum TaxID=2727403 RepID=A0AAW2N3Z8_9LAMI